MPKIRFATVVAAVGVSGLAAVALAGPAAAVTAPNPLTVTKAQALRTIDSQRFGLAVANWSVNTDRAAAADKTSLSASISSDQTSLTTLRKAVVQDSTVDAVTAHVNAVKALHVTDFVLPRISAVLGSDDLTALSTRLAADEARYTAAINAATAAGKNESAATAALTDYSAKVTALASAASSAHAAALPLTVAGFPGNAAQLTTSRSDLRSADSDLVAALRDVRVLQQVHVHR